MTSSAPEQSSVDAAVADLNVALRTHGGGVEQVGSATDRVLRLRMTGLCTGCLYKPLTTAATIRPFIQERLGLDVVIDGARISAEAEARVAEAMRFD